MTEPRSTQASLADIDRKLRDLEQELGRAFDVDPGAPAGGGPAPRARAEALADLVAALTRHIDVLQELRDELRAGAGAVAAGPPVAEEGAFAGHVRLNAGPFVDIGSLGAFERGLAGLAGVEDVHISGFEGSRVLIDLTLGGPVRLAEAMSRELPFALRTVEAAPGELTVEVETPERTDPRDGG
jgi:hypothetical protein